MNGYVNILRIHVWFIILYTYICNRSLFKKNYTICIYLPLFFLSFFTQEFGKAFDPHHFKERHFLPPQLFSRTATSLHETTFERVKSDVNFSLLELWDNRLITITIKLAFIKGHSPDQECRFLDNRKERRTLLCTESLLYHFLAAGSSCRLRFARKPARTLGREVPVSF